MYLILPQNVDGGGAVSSSLCFLYSSTICPGTAFSLKWRPMFLKLSVLSSHHDCCHSRLIPGSCLKIARQTARYCISFPSAIILAKRRYSSLCMSFHWRMSALNCSYVCFSSSMLFLQCYRNTKGYGELGGCPQSRRFTSSFFISSSILRYRAKARLPSECPDMEAIRFGSLTCL